MKTVEEIAGMVTIRNHLQTLRDRSLIKRTDYQIVNNLIQQLDQDIVNASLGLFKQQAKVEVEEEVNISKKIAEAKAKMAKAKGETITTTTVNVLPLLEKFHEDDSVVEDKRPAFKKKTGKTAPPAASEK